MLKNNHKLDQYEQFLVEKKDNEVKQIQIKWLQLKIQDSYPAKVLLRHQHQQ